MSESLGPDALFHFSPSKGDTFTMTSVEVADAMAFVRGLMIDSLKCKHKSNGMVFATHPPSYRCSDCGEIFS